MAAIVSFEARSGASAGERLGKRIAELNACINVAQAGFLELLREFDQQRYWEDLGFTSCAHWLNFKCGLGCTRPVSGCAWRRPWSRCRKSGQASPKVA